MNLKTASIVKPIILKGSRISHARGNRKKKTRARGQQSARRMHHSKTIMMIRMQRSNQKTGHVPGTGQNANYPMFPHYIRTVPSTELNASEQS